jgi:hypothetical protein
MNATSSEKDFESLRRQIRLIVLLDAATAAGLVPIQILRLHAFAYLSNVLSPVWDMPAFDGKVLKRLGGPFYPELQRDLDYLVGSGVAFVTKLGHARDETGSWRLEGSYSLNFLFSEPILRQLNSYEREARLGKFIHELALAISALDAKSFDAAVAEDATYSDPTVTFGNIVDFDEWRKQNYSANAAAYFERIAPSLSATTPGEKIHLYVRHLYRRVHDRP